MLSGRLLSYLKKRKISRNGHSLYHSLSFVFTRCHSLYHSLSLDVSLVCLFLNDPLTCASYSQIRDQNFEGKYSLSALTTHAEKDKLKKGQRPCIICNLFDHSPRRSFKISDPKIHRNIWKEVGDVSFALKPAIWRKNVLAITNVKMSGETQYFYLFEKWKN